MSCKPQLFKRPKHPDEQLVITFDFTRWTTTPASPVITVTRYSGAADPNPAALLSGAPQVAAPLVRQKVVGGVDGCTYLLECKVTDADGEVWVLPVLLYVCRPAA
jgi:hypothetical protein